MKPKVIWIKLYECLHSIFLVKPLNIIKLCKNKCLYKKGIENSYFPELKQNSSLTNFLRQVYYIIKYDEPEKFYFLYGMDVKNRKQCARYVNYEFFRRRRNQLNMENNEQNSCCILRNKLLFGAFSRAFGFKTATDVAYYNGENLYLFSPQYHKEDFRTILSLKNGEYFIKPLLGECGKGVFKIAIKDAHLYYNGDEITSLEPENMLKGYEFIVQQRLVQHNELSRLYPHSINTLRITTIRKRNTGTIHSYSTLRIGTGGMVVDNFSAGGIIAGVNQESGELSNIGYFSPQYGRWRKPTLTRG